MSQHLLKTNRHGTIEGLGTTQLQAISSLLSLTQTFENPKATSTDAHSLCAYGERVPITGYFSEIKKMTPVSMFTAFLSYS